MQTGGALGASDPIGLQRMDSFDLDLLMKAQHDVSRQQRSGATEFAALMNGSSKEVLPYLRELKPAAGSEPISALSMSNLQGVDDVGPSLASMDSYRCERV